MPSNRGSLFDPFFFFFFPRNACHDASVKYRTGGGLSQSITRALKKMHSAPWAHSLVKTLSANQSVQHVSMLTIQRLHSTQPTVRIIAITRAIPDKQSYSKHSTTTYKYFYVHTVPVCSETPSLCRTLKGTPEGKPKQH